jgi:Cdc6-like AAA superfamily ATPase
MLSTPLAAARQRLPGRAALDNQAPAAASSPRNGKQRSQLRVLLTGRPLDAAATVISLPDRPDLNQHRLIESVGTGGSIELSCRYENVVEPIASTEKRAPMPSAEVRRRLRQEWDDAVLALELEAERLENPVAAFARTTFVDVLKGGGNQLIWGRRGTGKTHLLRCLEAELKAEFDRRGIVPIYVNGEILKTTSSKLGTEPWSEALSLYVALMSKVADHLEQQIKSGLTPDWQGTLGQGGQSSKMAKRALEVSAGLRELLSKGQVRILPLGESTVEAKRIDETERSLRAGVGTSLNLSDFHHSGLTVDAGADKRTRHARSDSGTLRLQSEIIVPFSEIALRFKNLLDLLKAAVGRPVSLVLLLDEWSAMHSRSDVQPLLAELLKLTLSTLDASVKIACIPGRTKLMTPITTGSINPIGMEMGEDITAPVDLDLPCFMGIDLPQLLSFFIEVLRKQIGSHLPWAAKMSTEDLTEFVSSELFVNRDAFAELCQAAAFVPRDFLNLLQVTTVRVRDNEGTSLNGVKITSDHVRQAALGLYKLKERNFGDASSPAILLLSEIVMAVVAPNCSYFFLVSDRMATHPLMGDLYTGKLIHRLPARYHDQKTHRGYSYFMVDYCAAINMIGAGQALVMLAQGLYQVAVRIKDAVQQRKFFPKTDPRSRKLFMDTQEHFKLAAETGRLDVEPTRLIVKDDVFAELPTTG